MTIKYTPSLSNIILTADYNYMRPLNNQSKIIFDLPPSKISQTPLLWFLLICFFLLWIFTAYQQRQQLLDYYGPLYFFNFTHTTDPHGLFNSGVLAYRNHDFPIAFSYFTQAAHQQDEEACYILGQMYYYGIGTTSNLNRALYYLAHAPASHIAVVANLMGKIYYQQAHFHQALYYLKQSSLNNPLLLAKTLAQLNSLMPAYPPTVFNSLARAASNNDAEAQYWLGQYYLARRDNQRQNALLAARWFSLAARNNYPAAQYTLAQLHNAGYGVTQDKVLAYMWALTAANQLPPNKAAESLQLQQQLAQSLNKNALEDAQIMSKTFLSWQRQQKIPLHSS